MPACRSSLLKRAMRRDEKQHRCRRGKRAALPLHERSRSHRRKSMLRRCVLHTTIAAVMAALPIAATRAASARVAQAVSNPHDYTYSDPNIIDPSCRSKPDPHDCSADVGARELAAADALGDINLNLRRAAARDVDESKPHRSIRRGFNTRQLVDFGAEQSEAIEK